MDVDNDDNFPAFFLLFGVIDAQVYVINILSTYLPFDYHYFSFIINILSIICKVNNFHPFFSCMTVKNHVDNHFISKNCFI